MNLIGLIIVLIVIGLVLYLINLLPIDAKIRQITSAIVIVVLIIWLLSLIVPMGGAFFSRPLIR